MSGPQIAKKIKDYQSEIHDKSGESDFRRVGDNTTIWETSTQIGRVGMSTSITSKVRANFRGNIFQLLLQEPPQPPFHSLPQNLYMLKPIIGLSI